MTKDVMIRPFREGHADIFECDPADRAEFFAALPLLCHLGKFDQCGSHIVDGRILYVGGWNETSPGVAEMFIYPSIYTKQYVKTYFREARWWVSYLKSKYRRVQCWGVDTEVSRRWLSRLGFKLEGVLPGYTSDGSSMLIWGLTS
jgi:hypothetical protein